MEWDWICLENGDLAAGYCMEVFLHLHKTEGMAGGNEEHCRKIQKHWQNWSTMGQRGWCLQCQLQLNCVAREKVLMWQMWENADSRQAGTVQALHEQLPILQQSWDAKLCCCFQISFSVLVNYAQYKARAHKVSISTPLSPGLQHEHILIQPSAETPSPLPWGFPDPLLTLYTWCIQL